jgi:polyisoprenoid-binding protein YceI
VRTSRPRRPVRLLYAPAALALVVAGCVTPAARQTVPVAPAARPMPVPAVAAAAAEPVAKLWFTGASNIRRFACHAGSVRTTLEMPPEASLDTVLRSRLSAVAGSLTVPVAALDCGIEHMNADLRETLKAAAAPTIEFRLVGAWPRRDGLTARLDGGLTIGGVERAVSLHVDLEQPAPDVVRMTGEHTIRPSDYGIAPPRRFAGLLRVRDEVTVHFDVTVAGARTLPAPAPVIAAQP